MTTTLPSESDNWILPSHPMTFTSTLPNYEEALPMRVNREGVQNYIKSRGTLNFGDWAMEGRRMSTSTVGEPIGSGQNIFETSAPKVIGPEAVRNYIHSRSSTPNLIQGILTPPNPHNHFRVKREGRSNYERNQRTQVKGLMENYGKLPILPPPPPHTQGEMATNLFHIHKEGHLGPIFSNYGHLTPLPMPVPQVKGAAAEANLQKSQGVSHLLEYGYARRPPTPEPNLKGIAAHINYEVAQGRAVNKLFHEYGKLPLSARTIPKVKYGGIENFQKAQGNAMRKTLSQCPPSNRHLERPQSSPLWS